MKFISTRKNAPELDFEDVIITGLASDGGLYVPQTWPQLSPDQIRAFAAMPYRDVAYEVMAPFVGDAIEEGVFRDIIADSYATFNHPAVVPLRELRPNEWILELFHGPTFAFKDVALQVLGRLIDHVLEKRDKRATIVVATSGDTGGAAIEAFRGRARADVFVLHPHNRVSEVQRRQMTTPGEGNIHALAVAGDFDDCQARLKDMFNDFEFRDGVRLAGVNSINWARVLAQVVYYFASAVALGAPHRSVSFTVPTGNFGDIFAGNIARQMGLPIENLIIATNQNDILHRALQTSAYTTRGVEPSISPSMDIQVSSNFERALFYAYDQDGSAVAQQMDDLRTNGNFQISQGAIAKLRETYGSGRASESQTIDTITRLATQTGQVLCPHSAAAVHVADEQPNSAVPMITLATAHPAKFPDAVEAATGNRPALPPHMADLFDRPERMSKVGNDLGEIKNLIRERIKR